MKPSIRKDNQRRRQISIIMNHIIGIDANQRKNITPDHMIIHK